MSYLATSSIGGQTDAEIVAWVNAKLAGFVETYFDAFVHRKYQKPHMVTDPVIGTQLPNSMATAIQHLDGQTVHFIADESCRQFHRDPSYYLDTRFGSTVEPGCMVSGSHWSELCRLETKSPTKRY